MAIEGLMMIHIAGYDADPEECFEGLTGGALTVTTTTGTGKPAIGEPYPETSLPIAPGQDDRPWYIKLLQEFGDAWTPLKAWIESQTPWEEPEETEETRGITPGSRMVPAIIAGGGALALTGAGATLVASITAIQAFVNQVTELGVDALDPTSERNRLAAIANRLKDIRGILQDGLLVDYNPLPDTRVSILDKIKEALEEDDRNTALVEAIEALQMEVEFADGKASFKRGVFEYAGD